MNQHTITAANHAAPINGELAAVRSHEFAAPFSSYSAHEIEDESFISPRFLIRALTQWWYITLPLAVIFATISATVVMLFFTPVYRSTAVMKIASFTPYIAYSQNEPPMRAEEFTETQIELLQSPLVMEQILAIPEIAELPEVSEIENPASWLSTSVKVKRVGSSELYYVYLDGPDPDNAAMLVNAVLDGYFAVRERDEQSQTERVLELLEQEKDARADKIQGLKEKMRELSKDAIGDPYVGADGNKGITGSLHSLRDKLFDVEFERKMLEIGITATKETIAKKEVNPPAVQVEMAISESQEVQDLRALIALKRSTLHRIESAAAAGKDDRSYKRLEREIETHERHFDYLSKQARPLITEQLKSMEMLEQQDRLADLESQLAAQDEFEKVLRDQYREQVEKAGDSGDNLLNLEFIRAELVREENVFEMIAERAMALTTESRAPGRVALLQRAEAPTRPVESMPLRNLALAIFCSGCLPFGLVVLWELSVRRISNVDQLTHHGAMNVVGEVAKIPMRMHSLNSRGSRAMSLFQESIDSLRVGLVLPEQYQDVKVLAVTSAVHSEGKSSISSQLAVSISRSTGEPVLLIDGDLRAPDVHNIFQISNKCGFATVLDGRATVDEAIITSWSDYLHLMPAGRLRHSPHKCVTINSLSTILDQLRPRYGYIVIDTPPILSASEALLMAKLADGTVLCTRRNVSRESQVRTAYDRLINAGARPLGAVFNGVPTRSYAYTYGTYDYSPTFD